VMGAANRGAAARKARAAGIAARRKRDAVIEPFVSLWGARPGSCSDEAGMRRGPLLITNVSRAPEFQNFGAFYCIGRPF
jgi:hypothetical protein